MLVFSTQLCDLDSPLLPLTLLSGSSPPPPSYVKSILYTRLQPQTEISPCREVLLQVNFAR
jgi:hypothetical protein